MIARPAEIAGMHAPATTTRFPAKARPVPAGRPTPRTDHRAVRAAAPRYSTVGQLADGWLAAKAAEGALSIDSYRSFVHTHVGWARDLPLEALSEVEICAELRGWAAARQADGYAPATIGTHPGSLPPASEFAQAARGSFRSYVHVSWEDRVRAIESLRLPAVEVAAAAQLSLDLGGTE